MRTVRLNRAPSNRLFKDYLDKIALVLPNELGKTMELLVFSDAEKFEVSSEHFIPYKMQLPNNDFRPSLKHQNQRFKTLIKYYAAKIWNKEYDSAYKTYCQLGMIEEAQKAIKEIKSLEVKVQRYKENLQWNKWRIEDLNQEEILIQISQIYKVKGSQDFFNSEIGVLPIGVQKSLF